MAEVPFITVLDILKPVFINMFINWSAFAVLQHDSSSQLCKNNWGGQKQTEGFGSTVAGCNWHRGSGEIKLQVDKKD